MPVSTHSLEKEEASGTTKKHSKKHKSTKHVKTLTHVNHETHLLEAVTQGKLRVIKRLLDSRANPNHTNEHGQTPLMLACTIADEGSRRDVVDLLLRRGADTNMQDLRGRSALMSAVQLEDEEMTQCLLDHRCSVELADCDGNNALYYAAVRGNDVLVRKLVIAFKRQRAEIDHQNVQGLTPLLAACQEGHLEVARILVIEGGASPTKRDLDQFMTAQEWMRLSGFYSEDTLSFLSPSLQRKSLYRKQRKMKGIRTLTDYLSSSDSVEDSDHDSPNVFSMRQDSLDEEHLPDLVASQPTSMFGALTAGKSMFDKPRSTVATRTPGYALGHPIPAKPPSHSKTAFLTPKSDLYSSSYLSKRKSFLSKNPRSGFYHSGALEPLEGQRSFDEQIETDKGGSHGNKKKHDLLPPIKR